MSLCISHRDRCAMCLERESANCTVVRLSGDVCIHTHELQLLGLNMDSMEKRDKVICLHKEAEQCSSFSSFNFLLSIFIS